MRFTIPAASTLRDAWVSINAGAVGICMVVDEENRLLDTITDGDIRRAVLDSISIDSPVALIRERKKNTIQSQPMIATPEMGDDEILETMRRYKILHMPVLDAEGQVIGLKLQRDLIPQRPLGLDAMVMAGGFGSRLMPLTEDLPKPMLPVGGKPILEHIIDQLRNAEVSKVVLSTHYKPEAIHAHFGHGENFGVEIEYVHEDSPLGTAGALGFLDSVPKPLLVMNGDIVTDVDFRSLLAFHEEQGAEITVGVARYQFQVPFGVVECEGSRITQLTEKPEISVFVCAGIYLLSPAAVRYVNRGERTDMPELIQRIIDDGGQAASFPIVEYWLDVGRPAEYAKAQTDRATP